MQKRSSKSESTQRNEKDRSCWNFFTMVKVNGQWSTIWSKSTVNGWCVLTWQCDITSGLTWQYVKWSKRVRRVGAWELACGSTWEILTMREARAHEAETSTDMWRHVWCSFWLFLVGFCSGLAVLSFYAFSLTMGVTAVARFWQWLLDEGEGSGRTPEMSIGTRKSEEWLWYHVNNIKWKRKTK